MIILVKVVRYMKNGNLNNWCLFYWSYWYLEFNSFRSLCIATWSQLQILNRDHIYHFQLEVLETLHFQTIPVILKTASIVRDRPSVLDWSHVVTDWHDEMILPITLKNWSMRHFFLLMTSEKLISFAPCGRGPTMLCCILVGCIFVRKYSRM